MGTFTKITFWVMVLIGIYLVASKYTGINTILSTLSGSTLKGIATLQGRDVSGVTK